MNKALRFFTDPKVVASFMMYALLVAIGLINAELGPGLSYIANQTDT